MYIVQFGGYTLPAAQYDMAETAGLSRRPATTALPGFGGAIDAYGTGPDPLAADSINKSFILEGSDPADCQTQFDALLGQMMLSQNDWQQGERILIGQLPDGSYRQTWAKCIECRATWEYFNVNQGWLPVSITWQRSRTAWEDYADIAYFGDQLGTFADTAASGLLFDGGRVSTQAIATTRVEFTLTNAGNARVLGGLIELDGAIVNPVVRNERNGHWFSYSGSLVAGDRLTVQPLTFAVKLNGVDAFSGLTIGSDGGQLHPLMLEPGDNDLVIICTGSPSCTFRWYWPDSWS